MLTALGIALALRLAFWDTLGLDHFDEGGYAMTAGAVAEGLFGTSRYPLQHFLSPPFQFGTAGLLMWSLGLADQALVLVSLSLGTATVLLVFLVARRWFGRPAGIAAMSLIGLADFHILYSRSGLTDVAFTFWFLLALALFAELATRCSWKWILAAGFATALAWNTKYHGWLAVVIASGALVAGLLHHPVREQWRIGKGVLAAAVLAFALYLPWLLFVNQQPGGYARLTAEHASYLNPTNAIAHLRSHFASQLYLDGWWGRLAPGVAALVIGIGSAGSWTRHRAYRVSLVALCGILLGNSLFVGVAALAVLPHALRERSRGVHVAITFFLAFSALTPLYTPYPRLALPWLVAGAVLGGAGLARFIGTQEPIATPHSSLSRLRYAAALGMLLITTLAVIQRPPWESASTFRPKDGFRRAAAEIVGHVPTGAAVVVWGEPAVVFYLRQRLPNVVHVDNLNRLDEYAGDDGVAYLVTSIYADRIGGAWSFDAWKERHPGGERTLVTVPVRDISDVRLLDDGPPSNARLFLTGDMGTYDLRLHAMRVIDP